MVWYLGLSKKGNGLGVPQYMAEAAEQKAHKFYHILSIYIQTHTKNLHSMEV